MISTATKSVAKFNPILRIKSVKFPERFKGTIVERWALYWKNLCIDYSQAVKDLRTDIQDEPRKAFKYFTAGLISYYLFHSNPDELEFKNEVRKLTNDMILISDECINSQAIEHVRRIQTLYNRKALKYQSFGLFSILYQTEYGEDCDLYKVKCKYLQPSYFSMFNNVLDVGILGKWWNLYITTSDYDIKV